jgi:hypothetical protein
MGLVCGLSVGDRDAVQHAKGGSAKMSARNGSPDDSRGAKEG